MTQQRHRPGRWHRPAGLRHAPARPGWGFTLVEMLIVVAVLGVVAGMAVVLMSGVESRTDEQMIRGECGEIRKAVARFRADMGETPRYLAELIQPPDPSDASGGWWWRGDGTPASALRSFDPATGRGWNGPYLHGDFVSPSSQETVEKRLVSAATYEQARSSLGSGRRVAVLLSRYGTYPQQQDGTFALSHYQLDLSDVAEAAVRFVKDPSVPAGQAEVVSRLGLGVQP